MKFLSNLSLLSASLICIAAGAAFATPADSPVEEKPAQEADRDTILFSSLASLPDVTFTLPATPDSLDKENPFSTEMVFKSLKPSGGKIMRNPVKASAEVVPSSEGLYSLSSSGDKGRCRLSRFRTSIRPEKFFKGKLFISTPGAAKVFIDGKEILSKTSFDSIPVAADGDFSLTPSQNALLEIMVLSDSKSDIPTLKAGIVPDKSCSGADLAQGPDLKSHYNLLATQAGARAKYVSLSPDGKYILMTFTFSPDGVSTDNTYSVLEAASGKTLIESVEGGEYTRWAEDRNATLIFPKKHSDSTFSIISLDIPSMKRSVLADGLPTEAMEFSLLPGSKKILFYDIVKDEDASSVMKRLKSPDSRQPSNGDRYYLSLLDLADKTILPLTYGGPSTYALSYTRDGSKLLYSATRETPEKFPFYESTVVQIDLNTLKTDTIKGTDSSITEARYSPDGKQIMFLAGPNAFNGIGLNAGVHEWGNDFDIQAYLYDINSGKVKPMTRDFNPAIDDIVDWNPSDNRFYFLASTGFDKKIFALNPTSGEIKELPTEVDFVRDASVADGNPSSIAYTGMSYDYSGRAYLLNGKTGKSRLIADPMAEVMKGMTLSKSESYSYTSDDGTLIDGTITFPPDFDPAKTYPMITYYYSGTTPTSHTNHSPYSPTLFAAYGYIVYTVNPSGCTGYGQEYSARHVNAWGDRTADDIIEGVKRVCNAFPCIDKSKIGCIGASYGGFMTQLLTTKTDIFAAAVSHAGISNITSYWGEGFWGYTYNAVAAARSYPWNNPKLFTENSPLFHADKIHTPLLLLHGTLDTNVPIGESIQLYNALKILGRDVEFITVDGENHIIMDFQKRKEWHATIMAWFERWLKGDASWWNSIYK